MATHDQIEIIGPGGAIRFYELNPVKGFTNIGSHPDNDIVIPSPDVAPFHAVLDHRQRPCQIIVLGRGGRTLVGGLVVEPNSARPVANWETIELDGHALVLMESLTGMPAPVAGRSAEPAPSPSLPGAPETAVAPPFLPPAAGPAPLMDAALAGQSAPAPVAPISATSTAPVPDQPDELILLGASARDFTLDVDQSASVDLTITNGGDVVANFMVRIEGLDPDWVITPGAINLFEGGRSTVSITITPPRKPSSRAGTHYFGVAVTSAEYPGHLGRVGCQLVVNPYYETTVGELSPRQQRLGWTKRAGAVTYPISNQGNSETSYRLDAADDERALQFEFKLAKEEAALAKQAELRLAPAETRSVAVPFTLLTRKFFSFSNRNHSFTVTTTPLQGLQSPRALLSQAESAPLIGPWHVLLAIVLLLALIAWLFRPSISTFQADKPQVMSDEIAKGGKVTLSWESSWFADVTIDQNVGAQPRGAGAVQVAPVDSTTYRLTVATPLLSQLFSAWFTTTRELTVEVNPVNPIIRLKLDKDKVVIGDSATLSWEVLNADEVTLSANGALETIPAAQYVGARPIKPEGQTVYVMTARNHYGTVSSTKTLNAQAPTATPFPAPVIQRFDALPSPIIAGQEVTLEWSVQNAVSVQIDPGGQTFPPVGKIALKPGQSTSYILTAVNGPQSARSIRQVVVNPAPTPTPAPGSPIIQFFTGTPAEVALGSQDISNIQLAWAVTGDVTRIEISGDSIGKITGLPRQGAQVVAAGSADTQFVLTAYNGAITASQTVVIKVVVPVPVIASLDPPSTTNVGGSGLTLTVSGANFVNGSTVRWNDSDRPTTYVSSTQLTASITAADLAKTGSAKITVFNPADAGGGASSAADFAVNNPVPAMGAPSPVQALVGDGDTVLIVTGSKFVSDSKVRWNGLDLQTTYNNPSQLTAVVTADKLTKAGTASVSVFNPTPLGGTSGSTVFTIANPKPAITSLGPPSSVIFGSGSFSLTINGSGFVNGSQVSWGGDRRPATYVGPTQLTIVIPDADTAAPGGVEVAVINDIPGGGPSAPVVFPITKAPVTVTLSASPPTAVSGQPVTFSAVVQPVNSALTALPGGSVDFFVNGALVGSRPVTGATAPVAATIDQQYFAAGAPVITAHYNGDNHNYDPAQSAALNYTVGKGEVSVNIIPNPNTGQLGNAFTFNVQVLPNSPATGNPVVPSGGAVQLFRNGVPLGGTLTAANGTASYTAAFSDTANRMTGGTWSITATYDGTGDTNFNSGSSLNPVQVTVTKAAPVVQVVSSAASTTYGGPPTLTVNASAPSSLPGVLVSNAPVTIYDSYTDPNTGQPQQQVLGTVTLVSGTATLNTIQATALPATSHNVWAVFDGANDPNYDTTSSDILAHKVAQAPTAVVIGSIVSTTGAYGSAVTMTASVSSSAGTPQLGNIVFKINNNSVTSYQAVYNAGTATLNLPLNNALMPAGADTITAQYNGGDKNYLTSPISPSVSQAVSQATPSVSLSGVPGHRTDLTGGAQRYTFTITVSSPVSTPTGFVIVAYTSEYPWSVCTDYGYFNDTRSLTLSAGQPLPGQPFFSYATFTENITPTEGAFDVTVSYFGDSNFVAVPNAATASGSVWTPCS